MHWASFNGNLKMVRLCLEAKASVNALTKRLETPLVFATMKGRIDVIQYLLDNGADASICGVYFFLIYHQFLLCLVECASYRGERWEYRGNTNACCGESGFRSTRCHFIFYHDQVFF